MYGLGNKPRNIWVAGELEEELELLEDRMRTEFGRADGMMASRFLANALKKSNFISQIEFLNVKKPMKKNERLVLDWGFRL